MPRITATRKAPAQIIDDSLDEDMPPVPVAACGPKYKTLSRSEDSGDEDGKASTSNNSEEEDQDEMEVDPQEHDLQAMGSKKAKQTLVLEVGNIFVLEGTIILHYMSLETYLGYQRDRICEKNRYDSYLSHF